jgi:hypothetical protein
MKEALSKHGDKLSFVEVSDITVPGAFDEAPKDVTGVPHLAAPVSLFFADPDPVINTAKKCYTSNFVISAQAKFDPEFWADVVNYRCQGQQRGSVHLLRAKLE